MAQTQSDQELGVAIASRRKAVDEDENLRTLALGADFVLLGPERTMLRARVPVIAVSAVRTGCGKSQVARWLSLRLADHGLRVAAIRHPMPYGDLARQAVQRFAEAADLYAH